jgi:hypothetical protein
MRNYSSAITSFDESFYKEMAQFRVSPAAGNYLRGFGILPSLVTATGPKGHILKGDVLAHIE